MITGKLAPGVLRDERKKSGCTQQQLADLLGVDRSTYSYYESGRLQIPQDVLLKLAEFYQVPVSCFFAESDEHIVFHVDTSLKGGADRFSTDVDSRPEASVSLTFEEKRLLSQLRARSCFTDEPGSIADLSPMEFDDDAILSFLVNPDDA